MSAKPSNCLLTVKDEDRRPRGWSRLVEHRPNRMRQRDDQLSNARRRAATEVGRSEFAKQWQRGAERLAGNVEPRTVALTPGS